jgi:hypothetical protein
MSSKTYLTYIPGSINYKRPDPFKTVGLSGIPKPNYDLVQHRLVDSNAFMDRQKLDLQMRKAFAQADMTAYSQGNIGGKK